MASSGGSGGGGDVGLATALCVAAGAASCLGAAICFWVKACTPRIVARALGFAAGVMLYVVFTEIFMVDSVGAFKDAGYSEAAAFRFSTACLFAGIALTAALDAFIHWLMHMWPGGSAVHHAPSQLATTERSAASGSEADIELADCHACTCAASTDSMHAPDTFGGQSHNGYSCGGTAAGGTAATRQGTAPGAAADEVVALLQRDPHTQDLLRMGIVTGLAITLHNIPEGMATFVGAMNNAKVGATIAFAIAVHNVPEGICVAMPIFYATGSKWKGFLWGSLAGLAEPVGGLVGYLAVHDRDPLAFGITFGVVGGMMVFVSIQELLPAAFQFDPDNTMVSKSTIVGMGVMAASLLLFTL